MWYSCSFAINYFDEKEVIQKPIPLSCGLFLEPAPDWIKHEEVIKYLSWNDKEDIKETNIVVSAKYDADALGSPDPEWKGKKPRGIQSTIDEKFILFSLALWIVQPSRLNFTTCFHFSNDGDPASMRSSGKFNAFHIDKSELDICITDENISDASKLFEIILSIKRDGSLWSALWMLVPSLQLKTWETRYLSLWVVMEALFGNEDGREITYRLSQRAAFFLEKNKENRKELFNKVKTAYGIRSKTVHGLRLSKLTDDKSIINIKLTEQVIRRSLSKILSDRNLIEIFNSKKRDEYLDDLIFS